MCKVACITFKCIVSSFKLTSISIAPTPYILLISSHRMFQKFSIFCNHKIPILIFSFFDPQFLPIFPIPIAILPQLGSSPAIAVFINGELAIEKAIFFALLRFCINYIYCYNFFALLRLLQSV